VKLIAEPWDVGAGGYQVGNFPVLWTEWNGKYRDTIRRFWKGDGGAMAEFATRLCGSSDLYATSGRRPYASINFITCHDGFTLADLVSYNDKHNQANGENNQDGCNDNNSWNCGVEGPTKDAAIRKLRARQKRNLIATLLLSQGVPMLLAGDELSHTQQGNNNAYCQDSELSWLDWDLDDEEKQFLEFVQRLVRFRRDQPVLRRRSFFHGRQLRGLHVKDVYWVEPSGQEMSEKSWSVGYARCFGVCWVGDAIDEVDFEGRPVVGDNILILFNAHHEPIQFTLPGARVAALVQPVLAQPAALAWELVVDTSEPWRVSALHRPGDKYALQDRSLAVFKVPRGVEEHAMHAGAQSTTTRHA
jgi:glycogen operon protein